jgi:subtilisin family serine protease
VVKETDLGKHVDIHVIDIATPSSRRDPDHSTGELEDAHHIQHAAIDENQDGWADPAMGHGDFVRSVVELGCCLHATLWEAADPLGDIDDAALVQALQEVAAKADPSKSRILNLSLSGYNEDDRPGEVLAHQIAEMIADGWVIVAAAGNNASCRLAWPAALPGVVAVGAISRCAPAWFSNYGSWVDVSAPGVDVLARFPVPKGDATLEAAIVADVDDPTNPTGKVITVADFDTGWATWSGTSFAAPYVTARIARQLEANTSPPKDPADHRARARAAIDAIVNDPTYDHVPYYGRLLG